MKKKLVVLLLIISLGVNFYIFGKWFLFERWYEASEEEEIILSEMIQKTIESKDYRELAEKEDIIAIDASVDKFKGGVFPYHFEVHVQTDKQMYGFSCTDTNCTEMENESWSYTIYQDESPRLPFNQ